MTNKAFSILNNYLLIMKHVCAQILASTAFILDSIRDYLQRRLPPSRLEMLIQTQASSFCV